MNILKEGVKSALVRIVRLIVYSIIVLVAFYIIGLITSHKASALALKGQDRTPIETNQNATQTTTQGGSSGSVWFGWDFQTPIVNPSSNGYDLIGFTFTDLNAFIRYSVFADIDGIETPWSNGQTGIDLNLINLEMIQQSNVLTMTGVMFDTDDVAHLCWISSEVSNTFLCSMEPGTEVDRFFIINNWGGNEGQLYVRATLDIVKTFWNYESTEIINSNGIIIQQNQQQTQIIQQQTTYITDTSITGSETQSETALNGIASEFNDILNGWGGEWSTLTHIVLEPINVILYGLDSGTTCSPIRLTIPYLNDGQYIDLPCMSGIYNTYFGSFITIFMSIMAGLYSYRTILYIVRTIKELCDAENDKIEVIDL